MKELRYTLVTDGSSDRALIPMLNWLLLQYAVGYTIQPEWADLRRLQQPTRDLAARIRMGCDLYPCDILFVHRDAENMSYETRVTEIERALSDVHEWTRERTICVVPVRMTEAWLLIDEAALRRAAGNPHGQQELQIPPVDRLDRLPDPKRTLHDLVKKASERRARRLKNFPVSTRVRRIAEFIHDFSPLRVLQAFQELEREVRQVVGDNGWAEKPQAT